MRNSLTGSVLFVPPDIQRITDDFDEKLFTFRQNSAVANKHNEHNTLEQRRRNNRVGCRAEAGAYCFFGREQGGAKWQREISNAKAWSSEPDIIYRDHPPYDAKGIDDPHYRLLIPEYGLKRHWRYILVLVEDWPMVEMLGWMSGADVRDADLSSIGYLIEQDDPRMHDCEELLRS